MALETENIDKLYLELSQFTTAKTKKECWATRLLEGWCGSFAEKKKGEHPSEETISKLIYDTKRFLNDA